MRRFFAVLLCAVLCVALLSGCDTKDASKKNSDGETNGYDSMRIWDYDHPEDMWENRYFSKTVPALNYGLLENREDGNVYLNGEVLCTGQFTSFYISDLTKDGIPELCYTYALGSGIVNWYIVVVDGKTREMIYLLSDRMNYDYYLFLRDGELCVLERRYSRGAITRTGVLTYNGSEIEVSWDSIPNPKYDKAESPGFGFLS